MRKLSNTTAKMLVMILVVMFMLPACSATSRQYALDSGMIYVEAAALHDTYVKVEVLVRKEQTTHGVFNETEWVELIRVDATIDALIRKYDSIVRLDTTTVNLTDVVKMWELAASAYTDGRALVAPHWNELSPTMQLVLDSFDQQASLTNQRIEDLLENPSNANINQAVTLVANVVSLAVKIVSLTVI